MENEAGGQKHEHVKVNEQDKHGLPLSVVGVNSADSVGGGNTGGAGVGSIDVGVTGSNGEVDTSVDGLSRS